MKKKLLIVTLFALCTCHAFGQRIEKRELTTSGLIPNPIHRAEFQGGQIELEKFIKDNLINPTIEIKDTIRKSVKVRFTVNRDGKIEDVKIIRGISKPHDDEVLRIISIMPDWEYGRSYGTLGEFKYPDTIEMFIEFQ